MDAPFIIKNITIIPYQNSIVNKFVGKILVIDFRWYPAGSFCFNNILSEATNIKTIYAMTYIDQIYLFYQSAPNQAGNISCPSDGFL